jgi:uncharacterized membrane protein YdjX (TVP38/TMEM64 family)
VKHYLALVGGMVALLIGTFAIASALDLPLLEAPTSTLATAGPIGAPIAVGLLIADVVIPVPSSLLMIALGAMCGLVWGSLLSLVGSVGAGWLGFYLGRRGGPLLERLVPADERVRAETLLDRWGGVAVVATRPFPILAETVAILAGTSGLSWREMSVATVLGSLPAAVIYGAAGAAAVETGEGIIVFAVVLLLAVPIWLIAKRLAPRPAPLTRRPPR